MFDKTTSNFRKLRLKSARVGTNRNTAMNHSVVVNGENGKRDWANTISMLQYKPPPSEPKKVTKEAEVIRQSLEFMRNMSNASEIHKRGLSTNAKESKLRPKTAAQKSGLTRKNFGSIDNYMEKLDEKLEDVVS